MSAAPDDQRPWAVLSEQPEFPYLVGRLIGLAASVAGILEADDALGEAQLAAIARELRAATAPFLVPRGIILVPESLGRE